MAFVLGNLTFLVCVWVWYLFRLQQNNNALKNWLCVLLSSLLCVQDIVHLGVKLKARLWKPFIILPLVSFVAKETWSKVIMVKGHMVLPSRYWSPRQTCCQTHYFFITLVRPITDAIVTKCYIDLIEASVYSYLDVPRSDYTKCGMQCVLNATAGSGSC